MPPLLLLFNLLRRLGWKDYTIAGLVAAAVALAFLFYKQHAELEQTRLVYLHPASRSGETIVAAAGPVRIITRIVERPGETVTIVDENRGAVTLTAEATAESAPVPLAIALASYRTDRWLLAVQVDDLRFHDARGYTALAGYSFRNRVDVMAGWGGDGGKLLVGLRF